MAAAAHLSSMTVSCPLHVCHDRYMTVTWQMAAAAHLSQQESIPAREVLTREKDIQTQLAQILSAEAVAQKVPGCEVSMLFHTVTRRPT